MQGGDGRIEKNKMTANDCHRLTESALSLLGGPGAPGLGQKNYADAEPLLLAGYEGMKEREAKIPHEYKRRVTEALERLVQLYDAWGKPDQAAEWRVKLEVQKGDADQ